MTDRNFKDGCVFVVGGTGGVGSACVKSFYEAGRWAQWRFTNTDALV